MSRFALSTLVAIAVTSWSALAQPDPADPTPLTDKTYAYPSGIPYQVDPVTSAIRGPQSGYNICNSTTENQQSECQTAIVNNINDFCLWAPATPNSTIADTEAIVVAWCSQPHGARLIPEGALYAVQMLVTSEYIQIAGFINQVLVDMAPGDYGGELDPHGADLRGNPLGGLMYSNAFTGGGTPPDVGANNNTYIQINDWNTFIGSNQFCVTICSPGSSSANQSAYCQNSYDVLGCAYNMPSNIQNGTFEVCDADLKTPVGIYTTGGATLTYTQPYTGVISAPYTPNVPASSNCVTYQSSALYSGLPTPTGVPTASQTGKTSGSASASAPIATSGSSSSGASSLGTSSVVGILGTLFAIAFLS